MKKLIVLAVAAAIGFCGFAADIVVEEGGVTLLDLKDGTLDMDNAKVVVE